MARKAEPCISYVESHNSLSVHGRCRSEMKLVYIKFDRVFDIHRHSGGSRDWTDFKFEAEGSKVYGAMVDEHPEIPVAQRLLVAVQYHPKWMKIYGWKNLVTGELNAEPGTSEIVVSCIFGLAFLLAMVPLLILAYPDLTLGKKALAGVVLLVMMLKFALDIRHGWRQEVMYEMLHSHAAHSEALPLSQLSN